MASERQYYVYILANFTNSVVYTGVTNNLLRRVNEHRSKVADGFTKQYNVWKLVHFEVAENIEGAILREKQIKAGSRKRKNDLIQSANPNGAIFTLTFDELGRIKGCRASPSGRWLATTRRTSQAMEGQRP